MDIKTLKTKKVKTILDLFCLQCTGNSVVVGKNFSPTGDIKADKKKFDENELTVYCRFVINPNWTG
jgi:hypothetical protein